MQCAGYGGTWDYTVNAGKPAAPIHQWFHTVRALQSPEVAHQRLHHLVINYSRDCSATVYLGQLTITRW